MPEERLVADFDPYSEWLGIATDRSPPTPHELLGLAAGGATAEMIRKAAAERSAKVRKYCLGSRGAIANRLLGELASAQNVLISQLETLHDAGDPPSTNQAARIAHETPANPTITPDEADLLSEAVTGPASGEMASRAASSEIINAELVHPLSLGDVLGAFQKRLVMAPQAAWRLVARFDRKLGLLVGEDNTIVRNFLRMASIVVVFACVPVLYTAGTWRGQHDQALAELTRQQDRARLSESAARQAQAAADAVEAHLTDSDSYAAAEKRLSEASAESAEQHFTQAAQLFDEARDQFAHAERQAQQQLVAQAKSRAVDAKMAAEALLPASSQCEPYVDGEQRLKDAASALDRDRFADAKQLFDQATDLFSKAEHTELEKVVRPAEARARLTLTRLETLLDKSARPQSFLDGHRLFEEATSALKENRFEDAKRRFDEAFQLFAMIEAKHRQEGEDVDRLAATLETALKQNNESAGNDALNEIERIRPQDPRLASWKAKLDELNRGSLTNSIGMKLARIPAGEFDMGQTNGEAYERPLHRVHISRAFHLGIHEVTQAEYRGLMRKNPSQYKGDRLPVENVSASAADEFCRLLTQRDRSSGLLPDGLIYRLPTEAEWEYAARAATTTNWFFGDDERELSKYAWYGEPTGQPHPVGGKRPNPWGLFDMQGNVAEWCSDWHGPYDSSPVTDPIGPGAAKLRVVRGGSFFMSQPSTMRSATRHANPPTDQMTTCGFRVARAFVLAPSPDRMPVTEPLWALAAQLNAALQQSDAKSAAELLQKIEKLDPKAWQLESWRKKLAELRGVLLTNSIGMELRRIPAGEFDMGQNDGEVDERPVHRVRISHDFYLGTHEVSQSEYEKVTGITQKQFAPVDMVSAVDAEDFCRLLTKKERSAGLIPDGVVYRLPTEAEWEYAARAGTTTNVGEGRQNAWGLYNMYGQVREWCSDWHGGYQAEAVTDPTGPPSGRRRVLRGAASNADASLFRPAYRFTSDPTSRRPNNGFRVVRTCP